jgi:non-specific serine/threonine protein kinase
LADHATDVLTIATRRSAILLMGSADTLPTPLTRLLGREREAAAACDLLAGGDVRMVTLTGPPGVGKTRLAIEVAARLAPGFVDGAVFVPLAPVGTAELVVPAIAAALGVREQGEGPLDLRLRQLLRPRRLLLLLDNFEHLQGAAPAVAGLLAAAPELRVLATSRGPLRISGEQELAVQPFALPDAEARPQPGELAENPAVALFVERARSVDAAFALTAGNAQAVARIVQRLDGIPLAIELAAARSRLLGPQALLDRLAERLPLLRGGPRDLPPRQQTLEAAIGWSYDLLRPAERRLLCRVAVFAGSWELDAAEALAGGEVMDALEALVGHGLVRAAPGPEGEPRFSLLEMIREFAWARLADDGDTSAAELRDEHARWFLALAEGLRPLLRTAGQATALRRLEREHDNLRAALAWVLSWGNAEPALRLVAALWDFWHRRGHLTEGRRWAMRALALPGGSPATRARALLGAGVMARVHGDLAAAGEHLRAAAALAREADDAATEAKALANLSIVANTTGDFDGAERHLGEAAELSARAADAWGEAFALHVRAALVGMRGDGEASRELRLRALELSRAIGDPEMISRGRLGLAEVARHAGEHAAAQAHYAAALEHFRATGNTFHAGLVLRRLAQTEIHRGNLEEAATLLRESFRLYRSIDHPAGTAACITTLACLYAARGEAEPAARCFGAAEAALAEHPGAVQLVDLSDRDRYVAALRASLGADACEALLREGRSTPPIELLEAFASEAAREPEGPVPTTPAVSHGPHESLTERERGVLALLAQGLSYAQIGKRLFISPRTVDAHLRSIYGKLNVRSRHEAARYAVESGIA